MEAESIYPGIWDEGEEEMRDEYLTCFHELKKVVALAGEGGDGPAGDAQLRGGRRYHPVERKGPWSSIAGCRKRWILVDSGDFGFDGPGELFLGALVKDVGPRPSATAKP